MIKKTLNGFSLIEMLLTLIIMSLLVSAFVPVITKKLKSSDITVGSFGATVTSDDCDQYSSQDHKCIMCTTSSCSLCTSQMNLEAGYYVDPSNSCDPKECSEKFGSDCISCSKDGCSSCSTSVATGYYITPEENCATKKCSDKFGENCSDCNKDKCTSCVAGSGYNTTTNTCETCDAGYYSPGGMAKCEKCASGSVAAKGSSTCTQCNASNHQAANSDGSACVDKYCESNQYIDGITCRTCSSGSYQTSTKHQLTTCSSCPAECSACTSSASCTSCAPNYKLSSGKCTLGCDPQTVTLTGTTTQVTRFNMGDDPQCPRDVIASLSGVTFVPFGTECTDDLCCWYGEDAPSCNDKSGGIYSGCNRTVCKWNAADKICASIGTGWKLPDTNTSMASWPKNSTASTGLMLCNNGSGGAKYSICGAFRNCLGSSNGNCNPHTAWAKTLVGQKAQSRRYTDGSWEAITWYLSGAFGVRCVKE